MSEWTGKLLIFDKPDKCNRIFPKESKITYPDKCPVVLDFRFSDLTACVGHASVMDCADYLSCDAVLNDSGFKELLESDELYIGGFYNKIKTHKDNNGMTVIDSANLCGVSIMPKEQSCELEMKLTK